MKILIGIFLSCFACALNAQATGTINCGVVTIDRVYVNADREGAFHANKLLISLGSDKAAACDDFVFAYMENTHESYDGILSIALAAYTTGQKLRVQVENTAIQSDARRIAWVNLQ